MPKKIITYDSVNNELQSYLKMNRGINSWSHTSIDAPLGKYNIKPSEYEEFYKIYHDVVFDKNIPTYLTEGIKDKEITPLKIDIDLRYFNEKLKRLYSDDDINRICMKYMEKIEEYLESPEDDERLFYILEKPKPKFDLDKSKKKKKKGSTYRIKDGFHIMAPHITTNVYLQLKFREHVYKNCDDILGKYEFDNTYADIFDRAVIDRNNWQMYGSTKAGCPPYLVSRVIRVFRDRVEEVEGVPDSKLLVELLSVRNKSDASMLKPEVEEEVYNPENNKQKKRHISRKKRKEAQTFLKKDQRKLIKRYVHCLSADRAENFNTWMEVGWCLHNLHNKDDKLLKVWIEFSKKASQYSEGCELECQEKWDEMHDEGLGIGSLKMWAMKDSEEKQKKEIEHARDMGLDADIIKQISRNPTDYGKIVQTELYTHIKNACATGKGSSYDVAKILYIMKIDYHVCVSIKDHTWFYYNKEMNRWQRDDKGIMLKRKISTELYDEFKQHKDKLEWEGSDLGKEGNDAASNEKKTAAANIGKVMFRLKETSFKSNLMTECAELFYDKEKIFLDKLDSYNHLIGFQNGVYDLKREEYRKGRPEDYISKSTNIDWIEYNPESDEMQEIKNFYKQLFVVESVREYVLIRSASFLSGSTKDESFDIYSGGGGNGKSKHMELIESIFGDYAVKLPIQLLTAKRAASNAATPELARTKGARLCTMQEPDTKTKINVGLMKEMTGGDKIQARALYGEPFEFKPQFKMVLCCNDKPELPERDEGTWRRVRNTEFISKFTRDIHPEAALDFKIDVELSERFDTWSEHFMALLLEYHKKYKTNGLRVPDEIMEYTNEYRAQSNMFRDFFRDKVEYEPNITPACYLTIDRIYESYRVWHRGVSADNKKMAPRKKLRTYLDEKYGKSKSSRGPNRGYKGLKFIVDNLIESDNDDELDVDH